MKFADLNGDSIVITGAMSGTSLDGIDFCTVKFSTKFPPLQFEVLSQTSFSFPSDLVAKLLSIAQNNRHSTKEFFQAEQSLTLAYSNGFSEHLKSLNVKPDCLAAHGQTIFHDPSQNELRGTWQILNGHFLAQKFDLVVINQFRQADMAFGGQGAPLVPIFDKLVFEQFSPVAVLNIGGISNVTLINEKNPVIAFDCGPGNMIIDYLMKKYFGINFDDQGKIAANGKVHSEIIQSTLKEIFFQLAPPKSTGRELFNSDWIETWLTRFPETTQTENFISTATDLTAFCISDSITKFSKEVPSKIIVSGGGEKNTFLLERLRLHSGLLVESIKNYGFDPQFKEALCFALLGFLTLSGKPGNIPSVTGANSEAILGAIHLPPNKLFS